MANATSRARVIHPPTVCSHSALPEHLVQDTPFGRVLGPHLPAANERLLQAGSPALRQSPRGIPRIRLTQCWRAGPRKDGRTQGVKSLPKRASKAEGWRRQSPPLTQRHTAQRQSDQRRTTASTRRTSLLPGIATAKGNVWLEAAAPKRPCLSRAMKQASSA